MLQKNTFGHMPKRDTNSLYRERFTDENISKYRDAKKKVPLRAMAHQCQRN